MRANAAPRQDTRHFDACVIPAQDTTCTEPNRHFDHARMNECTHAMTHTQTHIRYTESMSAQQRQQRIEQLHAERGARLDRLKMQRHMLYSEQRAIMTDMQQLHGACSLLLYKRLYPHRCLLCLCRIDACCACVALCIVSSFPPRMPPRIFTITCLQPSPHALAMVCCPLCTVFLHKDNRHTKAKVPSNTRKTLFQEAAGTSRTSSACPTSLSSSPTPRSPTVRPHAQ
jgi:hypothetical protein